MNQLKCFTCTFLIMLTAIVSAIACDSQKELSTSAAYPLGKGECHEFALNLPAGNYFQITAHQIGVDIDLRLLENGVEIKSADSENSNSGFEFLPFIAKPNAVYMLRINWLDDNQTLIKNAGFYKVEVETHSADSQAESLLQKIESANSLYEKSTAERLTGNQNAAADYLSAIAIYNSLPETKLTKYKIVLAKHYLGVFYNSTAKYDEAVALLEAAAVSVSETQDKYLECKMLKELGIAYFKTGNLTRSNEVFESAIDGLEKLAAEKIGEVQTLPAAYIARSETLLRLNKTEQAIKLLEAARANSVNAVTENLLASLKLADVYFDFGDGERAAAIISAIMIPENSNNYTKGVFNKISGKLAMKTDKDKALGFFNKANSYFIGNNREQTETAMFIGNTYYYAKNYIIAKIYYEQSKTSFEAQNDRLNLAQIYNNLGVISFAQKEYQLAISSCETALAINIELQNELNVSRNLINLMYFNEATGNRTSAIFYGKWAINTIQSIKYRQLQALEKELRDNFQDSFTDAFRKLANLLIETGRISEAEQILRFIKEKEYQDYVRGNGKLNGVGYTKNEEIMLREAKIKTVKKSVPPTKNVVDETPEVDKSPVKQLVADLKAQGVEVSEILFVNTLVGKETVSVIATNEVKQQVYKHNISRESLNKLVFEFRDAVTSIDKNPKIDGTKLYDILVKPLEKDFLSAKIKKIVWSLDGVLRYVPISALFDGKIYLMQRFANIQLSIADSEKVLMPKTIEKPAIGMASSKAFEDLSSLPIAKNELDCIFDDGKQLIINSTCKKGIIKGRKVADEDFTQVVFEDALKRYKLIHLTSHFVLEAGDNSKSFLLLGGGVNRKYTMATFSGQELHNVEVLIMSACNTANFSPDGAEFESFAAMAQKQGAKAVIGTLWSVADVSTSIFMTEFYRFYEINRLDKAEAIRKAQSNVFKQKQYSHPYYWSPFVLFGNWK